MELQGETLPLGSLILDVGCGSGLSGDVLSERGYQWTGCDISGDMLLLAKQEAESSRQECKRHEGNKHEGKRHARKTPDLMENDISQGLPFRKNVFDAAISISVLQWLSDAELTVFFASLFDCLADTGSAVLQVYPTSPKQGECMVKLASEVSALVIPFTQLSWSAPPD